MTRWGFYCKVIKYVNINFAAKGGIIVNRNITLVLTMILLSSVLVFSACDDGNGGGNGEDVGEGEESIAEQLDYELVGIESGASIMDLTEEVIDEYDLDYDLIDSSEAAMMAELDTVYGNQEPIVVTLWDPHWAFAEYDLKYLDDPQEVFGEGEDIIFITRENFEDDFEEVLGWMNDWKMDDDSLGPLMATIEDKEDPVEGAQAWIDENQDLIDEWITDDEEVDGEGETIEIGYNQWAENVAVSNMWKLLLEEYNYEVELVDTEKAILYSGVADGELDIGMEVWIPYTDAQYIDEYGDEFNKQDTWYEGAELGLVVPTYMDDVESIEDLQ